MFSIFSMFSLFSQLTPCSSIRYGRIAHTICWALYIIYVNASNVYVWFMQRADQGGWILWTTCFFYGIARQMTYVIYVRRGSCTNYVIADRGGGGQLNSHLHVGPPPHHSRMGPLWWGRPLEWSELKRPRKKKEILSFLLNRQKNADMIKTLAFGTLPREVIMIKR